MPEKTNTTEKLEDIRPSHPRDCLDPWDSRKAPAYVCLTGIELPIEQVQPTPGVELRRVFVDMFSAPMMAFAAPPNENAAHPTPWAAIRGGFSFQSRVQAKIDAAAIPEGLDAARTAWLLAALLRLQINVPIRAAAMGNMPFMEMGERYREVASILIEATPHQFGIFNGSSIARCSEDDLAWVVFLPKLAKLYAEPRFATAFSIYEEAQWCQTKELAIVLIWSAMETFFGLSEAQHKTKAISSALSAYIANSQSDRDKAFGVVREMYQKRSRIVHAGTKLADHDFLQSAQFAKVAFRRAIVEGKLPG
ncbi:MAG: hypothetical protein AB7K67_00335 [Hyphomicrobiaceae bacterium]